MGAPTLFLKCEIMPQILKFHTDGVKKHPNERNCYSSEDFII